jgi:hypothetical protein
MTTEKYPYTYESSGNTITCPYCGLEDDVHEYDFNDDSIIIECECGKKFYCSECRSVSYTGTANCELNGEQHIYVDTLRGYEKCNICGDIKIIK